MTSSTAPGSSMCSLPSASAGECCVGSRSCLRARVPWRASAIAISRIFAVRSGARGAARLRALSSPPFSRWRRAPAAPAGDRARSTRFGCPTGGSRRRPHQHADDTTLHSSNDRGRRRRRSASPSSLFARPPPRPSTSLSVALWPSAPTPIQGKHPSSGVEFVPPGQSRSAPRRSAHHRRRAAAAAAMWEAARRAELRRASSIGAPWSSHTRRARRQARGVGPACWAVVAAYAPNSASEQRDFFRPQGPLWAAPRGGLGAAHTLLAGISIVFLHAEDSAPGRSLPAGASRRMRPAPPPTHFNLSDLWLHQRATAAVFSLPVYPPAGGSGGEAPRPRLRRRRPCCGGGCTCRHLPLGHAAGRSLPPWRRRPGARPSAGGGAAFVAPSAQPPG